MRDAGFDDHVRAHTVDDLLHPNHIFRQLNDGPSQPAEGVGIFLIPADLQPLLRDQLKGFFGIQFKNPGFCLDFGGELSFSRVNNQVHNWWISRTLALAARNSARFSSR